MLIAALAFALQAAPQSAQTPAPAPSPEVGSPEAEGAEKPASLTLEQQAAMRCAAALAYTAWQQRNDVAPGKAWPEIGERGREFFVRTMAKLMDDTGMDRPAVQRRLKEQSLYLQQDDHLAELMPVCLEMLDASGL